MQKIDGHSSSFWSALNDSSHANLGLLERQRVKIWLNRAYQEIEQLSV